jgi:ribonuclease BN (tRNA processing enzyme)
VSDSRPTRVSVRMYQVGFGDCFLLSFQYAGQRDRHMLIDFGSTRLADGTDMDDVAESIVDRTDGCLDVLVISHRHNDHVSGFGKKSTFDKIAKLSPRLVVRPWTEDPELRKPGSADVEHRRFIQSLDTARQLVTEIRSSLDNRPREGIVASLYDEADASQEPPPQLDNNIDNLNARSVYAHFGTEVDLEEYLPGVSCHVLGPPRADLWPQVVKQRYNDPDEFWLSELAAVQRAAHIADNDPTRWHLITEPRGIGPARRLLDSLRADQHARLLELVRQTDSAINNTSLILLLTAGSRSMLFPGDAQIENWNYLLKEDASQPFRAMLGNVDLYKVGHHGSRNATPKSLFRLWNNDTERNRPMVAMLSTKPGVHGKDGPHPVPKPALVDALIGRMTLVRTDHLAPGQHFVEVSAATDPTGVFEHVTK